MCRQTVTMLLPIFNLDETVINSNTRKQLVLHINTYNKRFSGAPRSFMDYLYDLPTLLRHAFNALFSLDNFGLWYRIRVIFIMLLAICYLLSPLDLIPEALFGIFGFLDDIFIIIFFAMYITIIYRSIVAARA